MFVKAVEDNRAGRLEVVQRKGRAWNVKGAWYVVNVKSPVGLSRESNASNALV